MAANKRKKRVLPSSEMQKGKGSSSLYRPIYAQQVTGARRLGLSQKQIAELFDVSIDALRDWRKKYPKFAAAWKRGSELADGDVVNALRKRALGYEQETEKIFCTKDGDIIRAKTIEHYPPEVGAIVAYLKARHRETWGDKREIAVGGIPGQPLQVNDVTPRERLLQRLRAIAEREDYATPLPADEQSPAELLFGRLRSLPPPTDDDERNDE